MVWKCVAYEPAGSSNGMDTMSLSAKRYASEPIGLELIEDDQWLVYFATFPIALFDSYERSIHPLAAD